MEYQLTINLTTQNKHLLWPNPKGFVDIEYDVPEDQLPNKDPNDENHIIQMERYQILKNYYLEARTNLVPFFARNEDNTVKNTFTESEDGFSMVVNLFFTDKAGVDYIKNNLQNENHPYGVIYSEFFKKNKVTVNFS